MQVFDSHMHSTHSPDGAQTVDALCRSAVDHGLAGATVTDHCDMWYYGSTDTPNRIAASIADAETARRKYAGKLWVGKGVEMAEYLFDTVNAEKILHLTEYDVVLGSVHCVDYPEWHDAYSRIDFGRTVSEEKITGFLKRYFSEVLRMARTAPVDVLAHLTCPLRYINGKYHRQVDAAQFTDQIEPILQTIIGRGIALELNTSGSHTGWNEWMPPKNIWELYRKLGGEFITIGSDAHTSDRVGNGLREGIDLLRACGFRYYARYRQRKAQMIPL